MDAELRQGPPGDLADEWRELHRADPCATPFTSPGWVQAWWRQWGDGARPFTVTVRDRGALVGLAPFVLRRSGPGRVLRGLGRHPGDYWDVLAAPGVRKPVLDLVAEALMEHAGRWDLLVVNGLPPGSGTGRSLERGGPRIVARPPDRCPAIALPDTFDAYLGTLPRQRRSNLRRHLRRLDEGEVTLHEVRDPEELARTLSSWSDLRQRQWAANGREITPLHRDPRFTAFMLDMTRALVADGLAVVREFRRDGQVVGVYIDLVDRDTFYWFLGGFDPEARTLGLGKIAAGHAIRASIAEGRRRFDFAHGTEPYKYWFGASDRPSESLLAGTERPRSRAALAAATLAARRRDRTRRPS